MLSSSIKYLFTCLNRSSIVVGGFLVRDSKNDISDWCFSWRSTRWCPCCKTLLGAQLVWTISWSPWGIHFPASWCSVGCLCFACGDLNIGSVPQRLPIDLKNCSWSFSESGGTTREPSHVGWLERLCITVHHSLCLGSWVTYSAWYDRMDRLFHRMSWILVLWTPLRAHS